MASKYTLKVDSREIPYREMDTIQEGCVAAYSEGSREPEILKVFDSEEEAISALKKYHTEVSEFWASNIHYWYVEEYYVDKSEFDEEGKMIDFSDVLACTPMVFSVIEEPGYKTLDVFDDFESAKRECDELDDQLDYDEDDEKEYYVECNGTRFYP